MKTHSVSIVSDGTATDSQPRQVKLLNYVKAALYIHTQYKHRSTITINTVLRCIQIVQLAIHMNTQHLTVGISLN